MKRSNERQELGSRYDRARAAFLIPDHVLRESPLHVALARYLRSAILNGALSTGVVMPSTRILSGALGISRKTVLDAYNDLIAEGLLRGRQGAGTFVSSEMLGPIAGHAEVTVPRRKFARYAARVTTAPAPYTSINLSVVPFRGGLPDITEFPRDRWAALMSAATRRAHHSLLDYSDAQGYLPLREAIAQRLMMTRAMACRPEQVFIVGGAQAGLHMISQIFIEPGDTVFVENPGWVGGISVLRAGGASLRPMIVDQDGAKISAPVRADPARLLLVSPSHQHPTGVTMSLSRRNEILDYATEVGAIIVEDDFENEYRYDGRPLASMQSMDRAGSVIYLGSFSKIMFPGLRLGYIVAPPDLISVLRAACAVAFHSGQMIEQAALSEFISQGHLARHVARMGRIYGERQEVLLDALGRNTADTITAQPADSGIFLLGRLLRSIDDREASEAARKHGVIAAPVSAHAMEPLGYGGLLLGYAAHDAVAIRQGVRSLAKALRSVRTSSRAPH